MPESSSWKSEYPFASNWLDLGTHRLHYLDEHARPLPESGPPILAVHGNPTWSFYWRSIVSRFRDSHRVVVPDHLGMGLSDKPQQYDYTLARHRDNLLALIERLDLRGITLVAHDWGGAIGLAAAVAAPDRFARIVLSNTGAFPPPSVPLRIRMCRIPILGSWAMRHLNLFALAATRMAVEKPSSLGTEAKAGLLAPYDSPGNRIGIVGFVKDIPLAPSHPTHATLAQLERDLVTLQDKPIGLVWGMRDWCFTPECLSRFQRIWPAAQTLQLTDVGHYVMEEGREPTLEFLQAFVARHPLPGESAPNAGVAAR
ncbi:MAG TPA: alpha/beta fold hydrolase [Pirellulaceae bacterium]|jgi:haloalkane dehalogenase|nr:alpha/beta fold hydrolase [Pirellulaceae bacterium]